MNIKPLQKLEKAHIHKSRDYVNSPHCGGLGQTLHYVRGGGPLLPASKYNCRRENFFVMTVYKKKKKEKKETAY